MGWFPVKWPRHPPHILAGCKPTCRASDQGAHSRSFAHRSILINLPTPLPMFTRIVLPTQEHTRKPICCVPPVERSRARVLRISWPTVGQELAGDFIANYAAVFSADPVRLSAFHAHPRADAYAVARAKDPDPKAGKVQRSRAKKNTHRPEMPVRQKCTYQSMLCYDTFPSVCARLCECEVAKVVFFP